MQSDLLVMDRSLWSTLAVQYAHDPARLEKLLAMVDLAADRLITPHLTIVLEAGLETCNRRIANKSNAEKELDALDATEAIHLRECQFYRWLGSQGQPVEFVEADSDDPEAVYCRVEAILRESIPKR
jgi:thymidylate kinase